jgi:hypothetical protein
LRGSHHDPFDHSLASHTEGSLAVYRNRGNVGRISLLGNISPQKHVKPPVALTLKIAFYRDRGWKIAARLDNGSAHPCVMDRSEREGIDGDT